MDNIAPKLRKCWTHKINRLQNHIKNAKTTKFLLQLAFWTHKIAFKIISKILKQPNFFHSQPSTLPKDAPVKFYRSKAFGLSVMISSVAPTRLSTFYAYLMTRIGNRNLKITFIFCSSRGGQNLTSKILQYTLRIKFYFTYKLQYLSIYRNSRFCSDCIGL